MAIFLDEIKAVIRVKYKMTINIEIVIFFDISSSISIKLLLEIIANKNEVTAKMYGYTLFNSMILINS